MLPIVVSADHSAARDVDCHSATGSGCAEDTDTTIPLIGWSLEPLLEALLRIGTWTSITLRDLSLKPSLLGLISLRLLSITMV